MCNHNFVIFGSNWDLYKFSYSDIFNMKNVRYIPYPCGLKEKIFSICKKCMIFFPSIFDKLWYRICFKDDFTEKRPIIFIFFRGWITNKEQSSAFKYIRQKYTNCKFVIFLQDLVCFQPDSFPIEEVKKIYDKVFSFDPDDCKNYDLIYHPLVFSKYQTNNLPILYDVIFIGQGKNRLKEIYTVYDLLVSKGLNIKFILINIDENEKRNEEGIEYIRSIPYMENLKYIEQSKCVLEIMQKGGTGYTQRGCEIVGLNKKLLTNNSHIKNAPFYNEKYISVFDSAENIDLAFLERLKSDEKVEFGEEQRENMSPKELLRFVENHI